MEKAKKIVSWFNKNIEEPLETEKVLDKFLKWFDLNKRLAFLLTFFVGIITHITMLTNTIMSQDGLWNSMEYYRPGLWETTLGRWGIEIMQRFNFYIAIPTISTVSCILVMAIAAVFITDLFKFKSKISVFFTSVILAVTPTLTVTLLYVYTAFAYCGNFLIATLVIWFIYEFKHKKIGIIIATCLFTLVLSIYQSYIGVSIGLCIMLTVTQLVKNQKTIEEIFINVLKTIVVVVLGGLLYYGLTTVLLKLQKVSLSTYKDINSFSIKDIFLGLSVSIPSCYKDFYRFFISDEIINNTNYKRDIFCGLFMIILALSTIIEAITINNDSKKQKIIRGVLIIVLMLVLPIGLNFINILVPGNELYALTSVQLILIIPLAFVVMEQINKFTLIKWLAIISCLYIAGTYYIADNTSYAALKMRYNQAYSVTLRMMEKMENTPGYNRDLPICIIGIIGDNNYPQVGSLYDYTVGSVFQNPVFHGSYEGSVGTMHKYMEIFLGQDVAFCSAETYEKIVRSDEFNKLNDFPNDGCTAIIENTMVIKLSNYVPLPNGGLLYENY